MMKRVAIPYLSVQGAADAIEFYKRAFGATETLRLEDPNDGKIGHAEISIGGAVVMLADEYPELDFLGPRARGGTSVRIHLFVDDVDAVLEQAVAAGASLKRPAKDEFYGERSGQVEDPFGHRWILSTVLEEMSAEEMQRRFAALYSGG